MTPEPERVLTAEQAEKFERVLTALEAEKPDEQVVAAYDALPTGMQIKLMTDFPGVYWALARLSAHHKPGVGRRYWGNS